MDVTMIIDTFWVLLAAILVFFMNLGFAAVEAGFARAKNTVNILSKNFIVFAVSSLGFLLLGWGLMFGGDNPFVGTSHLFILGGGDLSFYDSTLTSNVPFWGKFFFQLVFCGTAATIVSGAVAERIKYVAFIIFSFALTLIIYPIVGHWVWGGGWLSDMGFMDFAGDAVVHSLGGWGALSGALILGPRIGKYGKDGKAKAIPGHSMSLAVIGLFVLWLGWFGFNPGSTMSFQNPADVVSILMTSESGRCGFHSDDDEYGSHRCSSDIHHHLLDLSWQTGSGHDHQRLSGRPGGNHRKLCLCKRVKLPDHRRDCRCAGGFPGGIF